MGDITSRRVAMLVLMQLEGKRPVGGSPRQGFVVGRGRKLNHQNRTGYCKECFGRFILSPKGANASRRDARAATLT